MSRTIRSLSPPPGAPETSQLLFEPQDTEAHIAEWWTIELTYPVKSTPLLNKRPVGGSRPKNPLGHARHDARIWSTGE
jgi:hypothetical protein